MPGTVDEHPNWRRRLPIDLAAIIADDARCARPSRPSMPRRPAARAEAPMSAPAAAFRSRPTGCSSTATSPSPMRRGSFRICTRSASAMSTPRPISRRGRAARTATTSSTTTRSIRRSARRTTSRASAAALKARGMGQILDFVPNHMGIGKPTMRGGSTCWNGARPRPTRISSTSTGRASRRELRRQGAAAGARRPVRRGAGAGRAEALLRPGQRRSASAISTIASPSARATMRRSSGGA